MVQILVSEIVIALRVGVTFSALSKLNGPFALIAIAVRQLRCLPAYAILLLGESASRSSDNRRLADSPTCYSSQVSRANMALNDLEFAYAPVRDQVRDLREYL